MSKMNSTKHRVADWYLNVCVEASSATTREKPEALELDGETRNDYRLTGKSCWIKINNLQVYIVRNETGVVVEILPIEDAENPIDTAYAAFREN